MRMRKFLFFTLVVVFSVNLNAQNKKNNKNSTQRTSKDYIRCYSTEYEKNLQNKNSRRATNDYFENWIATKISKQKLANFRVSAVRTIPVVVHVINNGEAVGTRTNISDAQVISQITTLNDDYRKKIGTKGYNANPVGADANIEFALAVRDPNGNPTNGIDRVSYCQTSFTDNEIETIVKPQTIWDPLKYLNVWVVPDIITTEGEALGYAQFPTDSSLSGLDEPDMIKTAETDGVVIAYNFFGNLDYDVDNSFVLDSTFGYGRTATHEVGHWLGLRHIWGDAQCGTDYVADTPTHLFKNFGCFTHPKANSCGTADEMFENYMDYTDDNCMNIFTINQVDRFNAVLANSPRRKELLTSNALTPVTALALDGELQLNSICKASTTCHQATANVRLINRGTSVITSAIISISDAGTVYNKSWSGSLAPRKETLIPISLMGTNATNSILVSIYNINGASDTKTINNSSSATYNFVVSENFSTSQVKLELQLDRFGSETKWELVNSSGTVLYNGGPYLKTTTLPAVKNFTFDLANNSCYTFKIYDSEGDGICCDYGNGYYTLTTAEGIVMNNNTAFSSSNDIYTFTLGTLATKEYNKLQVEIYPNPVTDVLNITNVSSSAKYTVHSVDGKLVSKGNLSGNKISVNRLEKGVYVITIENEGKTVQSKFIKK